MGGLSAARWRWAARMVHRRRQVGMAGSIGCRAIHLLGVSLDPSGQLAGRSGRPPRGGSSGWREETPPGGAARCATFAMACKVGRHAQGRAKPPARPLR